MSRNGRIAIAALAALVVALIGVWWWALRDGSEPPPDEPEIAQRPPETVDSWVFDEPRPRPAPPTADAPEPGPRDRSGPEREERRRRWRERWSRRVEVVPLGENEPSIDPDAIREALRPRRPALRDCIREAGGWRSFRESRRAQRERSGAERRRGRVFFDVRADGTVDRDTLELDPPMPTQFGECFTEFFAGVELEGADDGARVELPLGPGRRRRGVGDGGVPRWRERGGRRGERRGRRAADEAPP